MTLKAEALQTMTLQTERLIIATTGAINMHTFVSRIYLNNGMDFKRISRNRKLLSEKSFIGTILIDLNGWIIYEILPKYRRNGFATEALQACRDYCLENSIDPYIEIRDDNKESQGVASRCGFACEKPREKGLKTWRYKKTG